MKKQRDDIFYNAKIGEWFFFGQPLDRITGLQAALVLSLSEEEIAQQVANDLPLFPAKPFFNHTNGKFYKLLFTIKNQCFLAEVDSGSIIKIDSSKLGSFSYTD